MSYIKTVKNGYTRSFPSFIAQNFENKLRESLRYTLWRLSHDIMFPDQTSFNNFKQCIPDSSQERRAKKAEPYIEAYHIITKIQHYFSNHYEAPCTMGLSSELKEDYEKALDYYKQSLSIIEADKNIDTSQGTWKDIKKEIQEHIERTTKKTSLIPR